MWRLALTSIVRRPLRSSLTALGVAIATALLVLIQATGAAYQKQLTAELNSMGLHMMLVPLGCPYDAAARVLKGNVLETSIPAETLDRVREMADVAAAAPLLIAAVPRPDQGRTDVFVGLDESGMQLKKWWRAERGEVHFASSNSVILGADAAMVEMREPGDKWHSPETGETFDVAGVLQRSGTSDDSLFFIPLAAAQRIFHSSSRLTAIAVRLHDPTRLRETAERLGEVPGAQVVTQTEMMGTFLNILGTVQTLLMSVAGVGLIASAAALGNTLLISVAERGFEFSLFRALGASRLQILVVVFSEAVLLTFCGTLVGLAFAKLAGETVASLPERFFPFAPSLGGVSIAPMVVAVAICIGTAIALLASVFPAWRASLTDPAEVIKGFE